MKPTIITRMTSQDLDLRDDLARVIVKAVTDWGKRKRKLVPSDLMVAALIDGAVFMTGTMPREDRPRVIAAAMDLLSQIDCDREQVLAKIQVLAFANAPAAKA